MQTISFILSYIMFKSNIITAELFNVYCLFRFNAVQLQSIKAYSNCIKCGSKCQHFSFFPQKKNRPGSDFTAGPNQIRTVILIAAKITFTYGINKVKVIICSCKNKNTHELSPSDCI